MTELRQRQLEREQREQQRESELLQVSSSTTGNKKNGPSKKYNGQYYLS